MFRATSCSSSGESVVSIQHLVCVTLCGWPSSMQVGKELLDLCTRRSTTYSDTYQMLYWYNGFSWWWAWGCLKLVGNWNKLIEKRIVRQVGRLQEGQGLFSRHVKVWNSYKRGGKSFGFKRMCTLMNLIIQCVLRYCHARGRRGC
jgi:hypothetical protein